MSETEIHTGKLLLFDLDNEGIKEYLLSRLVEKGVDRDIECYPNIMTQLCDEGIDNILYTKGKLYKIVDTDHGDCYNVAKATLNEDGSIDYVAMFYNGGTYLEEVLQEALEGVESE